MGAVTTAAFYCVSSELYFPGAVALVNSLRLVGHDEPIYLLDLGLTDEHRELLSSEVTLVDAPRTGPPSLVKTIAPLRHPAGVRVLIDVDMIATRSLAPLIDEAANGRAIAVKDNIDRFEPGWAEALGLPEMRRRPYVSSGLIVLGGPEGAEVLVLMDDRQRRVDFERTFFGPRRDDDYELLYLDQDVLNAVLASRPDPGLVTTLDPRLAPVPPFPKLRVDERTLHCEYPDGTSPYVVHQFVRKPWLEPMYHSVYSRLLARLLTGPDVAIRVPAEEVPRRLRPGLAGRVERAGINVADLARWYVRDVIPERLGRRRVPGSDG
jgi:hypothetical protein